MNILDTIAAKRLERTKQAMQTTPLSALIEQVSAMSPYQRPSLKEAMQQDEFAFILECKKASPSKGLIDPDFDAVRLALMYEQAGAAAISCLSEPDWFLGSNENLARVCNAVSIPVLKKDFIVHPYMIYEAARDGASAILLIAALLDDPALNSFTDLAHELGMEVLLEVHDETELERALKSKADLIGINNRRLKDFTVSLQTTLDLANRIPNERLFISESGILSPEDLQTIALCPAAGVLIGESAVKAADKKAYLDAMKQMVLQTRKQTGSEGIHPKGKRQYAG